MSPGEACVPNIGAVQRRQRWIFGAIATVGALTLLAILLLWDAPRIWRLTVALPAGLAALGFLQSREKT